MWSRIVMLTMIVAVGLVLGVSLYQGWRALSRSMGPGSDPLPVRSPVAGGPHERDEASARDGTGPTADVGDPTGTGTVSSVGVRTDSAMHPASDPASSAAPSASPPTSGLATVASADPKRVGVLAGHWQYDSGAVCADGRSEVDVTTDVAMRVKAIMNVRGYEVDLLPDHDPLVPQPPLQNYAAAAVVAVHADSCDYAGVSGFKVARWAHSKMPGVEDRLVDCLYDEYQAATLLARHDDTITADMWDYYAFRELAVDTPAAIIELGFLGDDRVALERLRFEMAMGIANGLTCFLERPQAP